MQPAGLLMGKHTLALAQYHGFAARTVNNGRRLMASGTPINNQ